MAAEQIQRKLAAILTALKLNPSSATAYCESRWQRMFRGDNEIALDHFARALRLSHFDPMEWLFHADMARAYMQFGRYEEAVIAARRSLQGNERVSGTYLHLAAGLAQLGRTSEAQEAIARLFEIHPDLTIAKATKLLGAKDALIVAPILEGLRKAGLPE
jgi:adenylate cyclase